MTPKNEYIGKMKLQLDELEVKMNEVEARAHQASEDARARYQSDLAGLRRQSKLAMSKLEALKATSEDTWESMVAEMEKVSAAFVHSFSYFKSQL